MYHLGHRSICVLCIIFLVQQCGVSNLSIYPEISWMGSPTYKESKKSYFFSKTDLNFRFCIPKIIEMTIFTFISSILAIFHFLPKFRHFLGKIGNFLGQVPKLVRGTPPHIKCIIIRKQNQSSNQLPGKIVTDLGFSPLLFLSY